MILCRSGEATVPQTEFILQRFYARRSGLRYDDFTRDHTLRNNENIKICVEYY